MEGNNQGESSKGHEKHQMTAWWLTSPSLSRVESKKKLPGKSLTPGQKVTNQNYQQIFEQRCSFCHERGLPFLKICVNNLTDYLDHLQVTHDYAYTTLCIHASTICSIFQPVEQQRPQQYPWSNRPLRRCSGRSHQPESGQTPGMPRRY